MCVYLCVGVSECGFVGCMCVWGVCVSCALVSACMCVVSECICVIVWCVRVWVFRVCVWCDAVSVCVAEYGVGGCVGHMCVWIV